MGLGLARSFMFGEREESSSVLGGAQQCAALDQIEKQDSRGQGRLPKTSGIVGGVWSQKLARGSSRRGGEAAQTELVFANELGLNI